MDTAELQLFLHQHEPIGSRHTMHAIGILESDTELFPKTEHLYSFWLTCVDEQVPRYVIQFDAERPYRPVLDGVEFMNINQILEQQQFFPLSNTDAPATAGLWYVRQAQGFRGESGYRYIICSAFSNTANLRLNGGVQQGFIKGALSARGDFSVTWHAVPEKIESHQLSTVLYKDYWLTETGGDVHLYHLNTDLSPEAFQITYDNLAHLVNGGSRTSLPHQPKRGEPTYYHAYPNAVQDTQFSESYIASMQALEAAGFSLDHRLYLDSPAELMRRSEAYQSIIQAHFNPQE